MQSSEVYTKSESPKNIVPIFDAVIDAYNNLENYDGRIFKNILELKKDFPELPKIADIINYTTKAKIPNFANKLIESSDEQTFDSVAKMYGEYINIPQRVVDALNEVVIIKHQFD